MALEIVQAIGQGQAVGSTALSSGRPSLAQAELVPARASAGFGLQVFCRLRMLSSKRPWRRSSSPRCKRAASRVGAGAGEKQPDPKTPDQLCGLARARG